MGKKKKGGPMMVVVGGSDEQEEVVETTSEEVAPVQETSSETEKSQATTTEKSQEATTDDSSDEDEEESSESKGKMVQRHKREVQELKKKTSAMLHSFSKNDKKAKKDTQDQIKKMEDDLAKRHEKELKEVDSKTKAAPAEDDDTTREAMEKLKIKKDKQIKKRAAKAAQEMEEERRIAEEKRNMGATKKEIENQQMAQKLSTKNLRVHEIQPDGNCLYASIAHQVSQLGKNVPKDYHKNLRVAAADYMKAHPEDFRPFLEGPNGDMMTEEQFVQFCDKTAQTSCWGGQLEIRAISHSLETAIHIFVAEENTPDLVMGQEFSGKPIQITFHRHAFGLGQHYNSVVPLEKTT